jgi:hypothetical protein
LDDTPRPYPADTIHLIRTTQQINVSLSQMADQKASILMGATFVVFTIAVNQASHDQVSPAIVILAVSAFLSAMLAVFAIMPAVRPKPLAHRNILFFGSFTQMTEDEYLDEMLTSLRDPQWVYRAMLRDIYQNGQVLQAKKYKFLGAAYRVFLAGLVVTMIVFALQYAKMI